MKDQLIAAAAVFIAGCVLISFLVGYAMLWVFYPLATLFITLVLFLIGVCMLLAKVNKIKEEEGLDHE